MLMHKQSQSNHKQTHSLVSHKLQMYRPYSEQRHDRYESDAVRDRLTLFPMASAVKSGIKLLDYLQISTAYIVGSFLSTDISWKDIFPVFHERNNPKTH